MSFQLRLHRFRGKIILALLLILTVIIAWGFRANLPANGPRQAEKPVQLGAYYFDGWSGLTNGHITRALVDSFPEREPTWGWITSTPGIMKEQINVAANAGLSFFSFCWYYPNAPGKDFQDDPLNRALNLYLKAPNRNRLEFCLLVANHQGFVIGPNDWSKVSRAWIDLFKIPTHVKVNGKPLIIFFSPYSLIKSFGTSQAVRQAFDSLRTAAMAEGLPGVTIAACVPSDKNSMTQAQNCGFDLLTGYNYHDSGFKAGQKEIAIDSLLTGSRRMWNKFPQSSLPYIPCITLNWDPRPWAIQNKSYAASSRYTGYTSNFVYQSITSAKIWLDKNSASTPKERLLLLYAWNEYGEGAWLTPSKIGKANPLDGVRKAMKYQKLK